MRVYIYTRVGLNECGLENIDCKFSPFTIE